MDADVKIVPYGPTIGNRLVNACLHFSGRQGAKPLMLQSFKNLAVALGMYERIGFVAMPAQPD